jgi:hypothetical protein
VRIHHLKPYVARSRLVQVVWEGFLTAFASRPLSADRLDKAVNSINARPGVLVWIRCIPSAVEVAWQRVLCIWSMPRGTRERGRGGVSSMRRGIPRPRKRCRWHPTSGRPLDRPTDSPSVPPRCGFHFWENRRLLLV